MIIDENIHAGLHVLSERGSLSFSVGPVSADEVEASLAPWAAPTSGPTASGCARTGDAPISAPGSASASPDGGMLTIETRDIELDTALPSRIRPCSQGRT